MQVPACPCCAIRICQDNGLCPWGRLILQLAKPQGDFPAHRCMAHVALRGNSSSPGRICLQAQSRARVWCSIIQLVIKELAWWKSLIGK